LKVTMASSLLRNSGLNTRSIAVLAFEPAPSSENPIDEALISREPAFDVHARDFNDLARQLER